MAPSMTSLALILCALSAVIWLSSAAGIRISQGTLQKSSLGSALVPGKPATPPVLATCACSAAASMPPSFTIVPVWSCTATSLAPTSQNSLAAVPPTLPKPCTAMRAPSIFRPVWCAASRPTVNTPRPVASRRPSEPPRSTGLPVTTPVAVSPVFMA
ncbi:hypothetical protein D3C71_1614890 [compost metagenome]